MTSMLNNFLSDERRRWAVLIVVCFGQFMIVLDTTIVNVALPALQTDLGFSDSSLTWVVNAYLIAFGSFLLLAGRLSDIFGSRRVFLTGLSVFTIASIICGLSASPEMLIAARFVQGIGGALTAAVVLAILVSEFPALQDRRRAMGIFAFIAPAGAGTGLLAGGVLTQSISWHWIFLVNVPIGLVVLAAARALVEHRPPAAGGVRLDIPGATLITVATMALVAGIIGAADHGWGATQTLLPAGLSVLLFGAFALVESRSNHPLVPPAILRVRSLMTSSLVRGALVTGMYGMFFLGALYLEQTRGFDAVEIGLAFLPMPIGIGFMSIVVTGRLVSRFGPGRTLAGGMAVVLAGMTLLATVGESTGYFPTFGVGIALLGLGMGAAFSPLLELSMADVPADDVGLASGIVQVSMQLAAALGLAVLSTLAAGHSPAAGLSLAMTVSAALVGAALLVSLVAFRQPRERAAVRQAIAA
ncbi:MAG: DHA2 family efflux MFS transporter permease subunit [Solirubrobacteraceae bacterium]